VKVLTAELRARSRESDADVKFLLEWPGFSGKLGKAGRRSVRDVKPDANPPAHFLHQDSADVACATRIQRYGNAQQRT
jgi:hypothetical protein